MNVILFLVMASAVVAQVPSVFLTASVTPITLTGADIRGGTLITLTVASTRGGGFQFADVVTASHLKEELSNRMVGLVYYSPVTFNNGFNDLCAKRPALSSKSPLVSQVKRVSPSSVTLLLSDTDYHGYESEEIYFQFLLPAFRTNLTNGPIAVKISVTEDLAGITQVREIVSVVMAYLTLLITLGTTLAGAPMTQVLVFSKLSYFARIDICTEHLDYVLHMSQISVLPDLASDVFYYAALVMNMAIFMAVLSIHWIYLILTGTKTQHLFPAAHFHTAAFASGGIAVAAFDLIILSPTPMRFVLGVACSCVFYSGIFTALYMLSNQCSPSFRPLVSLSGCNYMKAFGATIFAPYRRDAAWFLVVEFLEVTLLGALSAMPPSTLGPQGCQGKAGGTIAVLGVYFLMLVIIRPHRRTMDFVFWMSIQAACIVLAIFSLLQTLGSDVNGYGEIVAESLNIGVCVVVLLRAVLSIWYNPSAPPSPDPALAAPLVFEEMRSDQSVKSPPLVPISEGSPWSHGAAMAAPWGPGTGNQNMPPMAGYDPNKGSLFASHHSGGSGMYDGYY